MIDIYEWFLNFETVVSMIMSLGFIGFILCLSFKLSIGAGITLVITLLSAILLLYILVRSCIIDIVREKSKGDVLNDTEIQEW